MIWLHLEKTKFIGSFADHYRLDYKNIPELNHWMLSKKRIQTKD